MQQIYEANGVRFRYPADWELQEQPTEGGVCITVDSPETSFWSIVLEPDGPDPEQLLQAAVAAFREEYSELDSHPVHSRISHRSALGRDIEFVCLDMLNTACLRAFRTGNFTVFILFQGCDDELEETRETLDAITASLTCKGDELLFHNE